MMDTNELLMTALRAVIMYVVLLVVLRIAGKREVGNFTAFDLLVALMLGEIVDEVIFADVSLLKGLVAIGTIMILELLNSWGSFKSEFIDRLTGSQPTVVVENGTIDQKGLASERMSKDELFSLLRLQEVDEDELEEIKRATLEPDGALSVIKHDWAKPLRKGDVPAAGRVERG